MTVGRGAVIFGCAGPKLLPEERAFYRDADPFGFIVFARNIEDPAQLRRLTSDLREAVGRDAPVLWTKDMVEAMKPGSVVVDIAAAQGGNCELTQVDAEVEHQGVFVLGPSNLPATVPADASLVYARNLLTLLMMVFKDKKLAIPESDAEVMGTLLARDGALVHPAFTAAPVPVAG